MVMTSREIIAKQTASALRQLHLSDLPPVFLGFDGFVDSIISVVDKRHNANQFREIPTIREFAQKISAAAGKSSNYELVTRLQKLGGCAPIMANAMMQLGVPVTFVGALGYPKLHPVFEDFAKKAALCLSIANPSTTDALEFEDGKLLLGKLEAMRDINLQRIDDVIGVDRFASIIRDSRLIAMTNWTMTPYMCDIWQWLLDDVVSKFNPSKKSHYQLFIDLADPEKRTQEDLKNALQLISAFQQHINVTLGLNLKEATQTASALHVDIGSYPETAMEAIATKLRERMNIDTVVIHTRTGAVSASRNESATFPATVIRHPKISTGAGDHFNAGFCLAKLVGMPIDKALCLGVATSGYYVRNAISPTIHRLADFCESPEMTSV
jgi:sugar/nucleoside kinase (ribokinase family)